MKAITLSDRVRLCSRLGPVHTELLAIAMQKLVENFVKEWVKYPFLAMPANAIAIANA